MVALFSLLSGILSGLIAGSFLATLVVRWPRGETLGQRSHCDGCQRRLRAIELVPVLSWAALGGRCRGCGAPIDRRHIGLELAAALIGGLAMLAAPGLDGAAGALFGWMLLALIALDSEHFWLPDRITLPLLSLGLAFGLGGLADRLLGAALAGGLLWALALAYRRLRGRDGLGFGDVKLASALGAWLGPFLVGPLLGLAAALGLLLAFFAANRDGGNQDSGDQDSGGRIPFGACLAVAAFPLWLHASGAAVF